jgi:hypothetical protein
MSGVDNALLSVLFVCLQVCMTVCLRSLGWYGLFGLELMEV